MEPGRRRQTRTPGGTTGEGGGADRGLGRVGKVGGAAGGPASAEGPAAAARWWQQLPKAPSRCVMGAGAGAGRGRAGRVVREAGRVRPTSSCSPVAADADMALGEENGAPASGALLPPARRRWGRVADGGAAASMTDPNIRSVHTVHSGEYRTDFDVSFGFAWLLMKHMRRQELLNGVGYWNKERSGSDCNYTVEGQHNDHMLPQSREHSHMFGHRFVLAGRLHSVARTGARSPARLDHNDLVVAVVQVAQEVAGEEEDYRHQEVVAAVDLHFQGMV